MVHHYAARIGLSLCLISSCADPEPVQTRLTIAPAAVTTTLQSIKTTQQKNDTQLLRYTASLRDVVEDFLASPNQANLDMARQAWIEAHNAFLRSAFLTHVDTDLAHIDQWPIQEGFIDRLPDYPNSGIINDLSLELSRPTLMSQHEITDREEVSLGFHPVEFLLFNKEVANFQQDSQNHQRRAQYLKVGTSILLDSIEEFVNNREQQSGSLAATSTDIPQPLLLILVRAHQAVVPLFSHANQLTDPASGHARFSKTSISALASQIDELKILTGPDSNLGKQLAQIDATNTGIYHDTLEKTQQTLTVEILSEGAQIELPLLIAVLGHQIEDFIKLMNSTMPNQDLSLP